VLGPVVLVLRERVGGRWVAGALTDARLQALLGAAVCKKVFKSL
jgi:hypothetical protein